MRQAQYRLFLLPLIFMLACVGAYAQANSTVTGIVTDQTGAVVSGATITLTDPATNFTKATVSGSTGLYDIPGLNAANYIMRVTAKGFQAYTQTGIVVNISATFRVDVKLTVGAENTTVTVVANALAVQSDSNVVSTLINEQQITELPTNGRSVIGLAAMGLGVSGNLPDAENPFSVNANYAISFNGLNQHHNIWIIDGGEAYDRGSGGKMSVMPSQDSLSEFQVLASNYPPDYGISSGGTVTMSIKNGTQKFHGEAWEFVRNDAFNAHRYFDNNNGQNAPKAELRYNVFGANVGGPVFIPHVYNESKKKTFFFFNEEWRRMVNGQSTNPINTIPASNLVTSASDFVYEVPTYNNADQLGRDVDHQLAVPLTNDPVFNGKLTAAGIELPTLNPDGTENYAYFPGNKIPGSLLDANALLFNTTKNLPPATNTTNDTYTPTGGHLPITVREELFRVDHTINDKWQLLGHFIHDANDSVQPTPEWQGDNFPTVGSNFSNPSYSAVIKLTGSITPNALLEASFNYDGNKIAIIPVAAGGANFTKPSGWSTGTYFAAANDVGNRLPDLIFKTIPIGTSANGTSKSEWGPGNDPWTNGAEDYNEVFGFSITHGTHAMKFGGGFNRYTKNQVIGKNSEGDYTFDDGWVPPSATASGHHPIGVLTGDSYLDFLLGLATNFSQSNANPINHYVNNTISAYAMDNWHVTPRLSLQLGLRYDAMPHVWERNNQVSNFVSSLYQPALAPTFNSDGSFASSSPGLQTFSLSGVATQFYMNGIALAGKNGTPRGLAKQDYKTLMPRLGFSYDLTGGGKTILRGGAGAFYERIQGNDIYDAAGSAPFISTPSANNVEFTNPSYNWQSGTAASTPLFTQGYNSLNTYYPNPAVVQYSLGVQHELAPALILITQYVGNLDWHQNVWVPINNFPLSTPIATRQAYAAGSLKSVQTQGAQTYPGFGNIRLQSNPATGSYNSFQVGVRQQNRHGLSFEADYTWSHQIDSMPGSVDVDNNNPTYNPWNLKYDRGSGILDRRNVLNVNYEYKLPIFAHSNGLAHSVLGGWELAGTFVTESGMPWFGGYAPKNSYGDTVGMGGDYSIRPNITGKPHYTRGKTTVGNVSGYQYVAKDAFSAPTAAWLGGSNMGFGNSGKDAVVGAGRTNFTTSIYKSFAFGERSHFEFRVESFNTFNHTQFNALADTNPGDNAFGFVSGTQDPRTLEFGGKFVF
jgi:hypothetical protein